MTINQTTNPKIGTAELRLAAWDTATHILHVFAWLTNVYNKVLQSFLADPNPWCSVPDFKLPIY